MEKKRLVVFLLSCLLFTSLVYVSGHMEWDTMNPEQNWPDPTGGAGPGPVGGGGGGGGGGGSGGGGYCGDGTCGTYTTWVGSADEGQWDTITETSNNCPQDCPSRFYCNNNGDCEWWENRITCPRDCIPCTDKCSASGNTECYSSSSYRVCGNYNSDSCLEWSSPVQCPTGDTCDSGLCRSDTPPTPGEVPTYTPNAPSPTEAPVDDPPAPGSCSTGDSSWGGTCDICGSRYYNICRLGNWRTLCFDVSYNCKTPGESSCINSKTARICTRLTRDIKAKVGGRLVNAGTLGYCDWIYIACEGDYECSNGECCAPSELSCNGENCCNNGLDDDCDNEIDNADTECCDHRTCEEYAEGLYVEEGKECGSLSDGCGSNIYCENCDLGEICVNNQCESPVCSNDNDCNDDNACTSNVCNNPGTLTAVCSSTSISCDDNNQCTIDTCDPSSGCQHTTIICNDNDPCTENNCDPSSGCQYPAKNCGSGKGCRNGKCCNWDRFDEFEGRECCDLDETGDEDCDGVINEGCDRDGDGVIDYGVNMCDPSLNVPDSSQIRGDEARRLWNMIRNWMRNR